jgi:hypothetical protein
VLFLINVLALCTQFDRGDVDGCYYIQYVQDVHKMLGQTPTVKYLHQNKEKEVHANICLEMSSLSELSWKITFNNK